MKNKNFGTFVKKNSMTCRLRCLIEFAITVTTQTNVEVTHILSVL